MHIRSFEFHCRRYGIQPVCLIDPIKPRVRFYDDADNIVHLVPTLDETIADSEYGTKKSLWWTKGKSKRIAKADFAREIEPIIKTINLSFLEGGRIAGYTCTTKAYRVGLSYLLHHEPLHGLTPFIIQKLQDLDPTLLWGDTVDQWLINIYKAAKKIFYADLFTSLSAQAISPLHPINNILMKLKFNELL